MDPLPNPTAWTFQAPPPAPVSPRDRLVLIDSLRGLALFGILLVNMLGFATPWGFWGERVWHETADLVALAFIEFFGEGKFYSMFSFLFGLGLALQMERAERDVAPVFVRRMIVLFVIGLLHGIFLWWGDILASYAVLGLFLLLFRNAQIKAILIVAAVCFAFSVSQLIGGLPFVSELEGDIYDLLPFLPTPQETLLVYSEGTYFEMLRHRLVQLAIVYFAEATYAPHYFALFLVGLAAGKVRLFRDLPAHLPLLRKVLVVSLLVGIVFNGIYAAGNYYMDSGMWTYGTSYLFRLIGGPAFAAVYICGIALLWQRGAIRVPFSFLAPVGRMALTNYLMQTVICTTIFYSYGLGLFGQVSPAQGIVLTVGIFLFQMVFSFIWLSQFRFGPIEWLWRSITYGKAQPIGSR